MTGYKPHDHIIATTALYVAPIGRLLVVILPLIMIGKTANPRIWLPIRALYESQLKIDDDL